MYLEHFELKEAPFSITPDPRFVFLTAQHQDALAHLLFGITQGGGGGFVQLTGEVGTGKTTLCRLLMAQVPEHVRIALVLNPMQQPLELLRTICDELRILIPKRNSSIKVLTDALTRYLLEAYAAGLRVVLIIDEAQNLSFEAFEQVRLLTNLETPTQKLLQIILLGQPELREMLSKSDLRQLAQRITARFHLAPLSKEDVAAYVEHRLAVAGRKRRLFTGDALRELSRRTSGFPRAINVIADRAMLGAYARSLDSIDAALVGIAADEVSGKRASRWQRPAPRLALLVVACALVTVSLLFVWRWPGTPTSVVDAQPLVARTEVSAQAPEPDSFDDAVSAMAIVAGWWQGAARTGGGCGDARPGEALCARLRVNESMMRALDRPLVLELRAGERQRWLALRRLQSEVAQIAGMNSLANADWRAQAEQWLGDVVLVVASPVGYDGAVIAEGAAGPLVTRIHEALSAFDGTTVEGVDHLFSATTTQRVRALQAHHGLRADGLVGPETLALLVALGKDGPRLSDPLDPKSFVSAEQP